MSDQPRAWDLYAGRRASRREDDPEFTAVGPHPRYTQAHGYEPVPVTATEDPDGTYWGYIRTGRTDVSMVYEHESLFRMCFPYGVDSEVAVGKGEVVRLRIAERHP